MKHTLICTVGTSLFTSNLSKLPNTDNYDGWLSLRSPQERQYLSLELVSKLKTALDSQDWQNLALLLSSIPGNTRLCGAEINSITDLIERKYCANNCALMFCHSATSDGRQIAKILEYYYQALGHKSECVEIEDLQDKDPKLFRTKGLRNLAKEVSQIVRNYNAQSCAINATGGYKAQIAIAVLMGQALGVAVYYKHELFSEIIAFPPMPIGLDFSLWLENSGWLTALDRGEILASQEVEENWDERMEALVERIEMDGKEWLELSPTGQIFHETFKGRFESDRDRVLPPAVAINQKKSPHLTDHGWGNARQPILNFLQAITSNCTYVHSCRTHYWHPDLSSSSMFRSKGEDIEGIFSNGSWTVKFTVETSASTQGQRAACIADLSRFAEDYY